MSKDDTKLKNIPKAELHVHIEGTITPELAHKLAQKNGLIAEYKTNADNKSYQIDGFLDFLAQYDSVAACIRSAEDYEHVVYDYLRRCAAENVLYVEFFGTKDHGDFCGVPYPQMVDAMAKAAQKAEEDFGIVSRCIMTCVRHFGVEKAVPAAQAMIDYPHPFVVGFGIAGDENAHHFKDFQPAFKLVQDAGYATTAHAGEAAGPESIRDALHYLNVKRIGHGVRAIEDPELVQELAEQKIHLEISPGSNIALGFYDSHQLHPLPKLLDAGCSLSLNSDDPPFFNTTIGNEYLNAAREWNFNAAQLLDITRMAIKNSFCDEQTKKNLLIRLDHVND